MRTRLHFLNKLELPMVTPEMAILIYDRKLLRAVPGFKNWLKKYPHAFPVNAGEKLKSFSNFVSTAEKIHRAVGEDVTRSWSVVAIGGGSVGDFAGFFASVYRRGLGLIHVPTTWLAAIDSSHGGKTALNLGGAKNQIGTFYPATDTVLVKAVLLALPASSFDDAVGELAKIAMLDGHGWARRLRLPSEVSERADWLWKHLPQAIGAKLRIVKRDPLETRGDRQFLNLGHTFGHVIEADRGLSHGRSIAQGLLFAIDVSEALKTLSTKGANERRQWLRQLGISRDSSLKLAKDKALRLLRSDKKREAGDDVWFILPKDFGQAERRRIRATRLLAIAKSAGWLK